MPSHQVSITIARKATELRPRLAAVLQNAGWLISNAEGWSWECQDTAAGGFTNPVTLKLQLFKTDDDGTRFDLSGSNFGIGPVQSNHVKTRVEAAAVAIRGLEAASLSSGPPPLPAKPEVVVNGEPLSAQARQLLTSQNIEVNAGRFWYDNMTGAWGHEGGPTAGLLPAGLELGGALREDASNGNSGSWINGRQLHFQDLAGLQKVFGAVYPGRYWMDAMGNFGAEGGPPLGNVWALAASQPAAPKEGILSTYDKTGCVVIG